MSILLLFFILFVLFGFVSMFFNGVSHRRKYRKENMKVNSLFWHIRQANQEEKRKMERERQEKKARKKLKFNDESSLHSTPVVLDTLPKNNIPKKITIGNNINFQYLDYNSALTEREVRVIRYYPDRKTFDAYCYLRGDIRTFKGDRIRGYVTDVDTGESATSWGWRLTWPKPTNGSKYYSV